MSKLQFRHMIEQNPAAAAYPVFRTAVLPWTSEAGALGLNDKTLNCCNHFIIELWAAIKDQVAGCGVIGERLAQLLNGPCTFRMAHHLALKNTPPVMRDDEKAVEHLGAAVIILDSVLKEITAALTRGEAVELPFGTLQRARHAHRQQQGRFLNRNTAIYEKPFTVALKVNAVGVKPGVQRSQPFGYG